jgi:hypothetical protein
MKAATRLALVALFAVCAACSNNDPTSPTSAFLNKTKTTGLSVAGSTTFLSLKQNSQLTATVTTPQGVASVTDKVTWTSADPAIATVSSGGLVTSVAYGSTNIVVRLNEEDVTQHVDVLAATGMTLSGATSFTTLTRTNQLTLIGSWPGGITKNVTSDATWSSDNNGIATISSTGALRSVGFGSATITAKYQSLTVTAKVDVVASFTSLTIQGSLNLGSVGAMSALTVLAKYTDGTSKDVTAQTTWTTSDPTVAQISPMGVVTATGFGQASLTANFQGHSSSVMVIVTPPGSFLVSGRVREPGAGQGEGLGIGGFLIRNTRSGVTTTSTETGYTLYGILPGDRVTYEKDQWETAEIVFNKATDDASPAVQPVVMIPLGSSAKISTAPNDLVYDLGGVTCSPCRRVRISSGTATTGRLQLSWTGTTSRLSIWSNGQAFTAAPGPAVVTADIPLTVGENIVYVGLLGGAPFSTGYLSLSLTTSVATAGLSPRR